MLTVIDWGLILFYGKVINKTESLRNYRFRLTITKQIMLSFGAGKAKNEKKTNSMQLIIFSKSQYFKRKQFKANTFPKLQQWKANSVEVFNFVIFTLNFLNSNQEKKIAKSALIFEAPCIQTLKFGCKKLQRL